MYIAFDGPDNSGKTTLIKALSYLFKQYFPNISIKTIIEPTPQLRSDTSYNKLFATEKELLINNLKTQSDQSLQQLLDNTITLFKIIQEDRTKQYDNIVLPFIWREPLGILLSDRSILSSLVYQYQLIRHIMKLAMRHKAITKTRYNEYIKQLNEEILTPILNYRLYLPYRTYILFGNQNKKANSEGLDDADDIQKIITTLFISLYTNNKSNNKIELPLHKIQLINSSALTPFIKNPDYKLLQILGLYPLFKHWNSGVSP